MDRIRKARLKCFFFSSSKCKRVIKEDKQSNLLTFWPFLKLLFLLWVMASSQKKKKSHFTYWPNICKIFTKHSLAPYTLDTLDFLWFGLPCFILFPSLRYSTLSWQCCPHYSVTFLSFLSSRNANSDRFYWLWDPRVGHGPKFEARWCSAKKKTFELDPEFNSDFSIVCKICVGLGPSQEE